MVRARSRFFVLLCFLAGCVTPTQKVALHDTEVGTAAIAQGGQEPAATIAEGAHAAVASVNRKHNVPKATQAEVDQVRAAPAAYAARAKADAAKVDAEVSLWQRLTGAIHPALALTGIGVSGIGVSWLMGSFLSRFPIIRSVAGRIGRTFQSVRENHERAEDEITTWHARAASAEAEHEIRLETCRQFILAVEAARARLRLFDVALRRTDGPGEPRDVIESLVVELSEGKAETVQDLFLTALVDEQEARGVRREIADLRREAKDGGTPDARID